MEHRNVHGFLKRFFDIKAFRPFDIFQIDTAKGRLKQLYCTDQFIGIFGVQFNIKNINVGKTLEQDAFPLHNRLSCKRADISKAEHCCSVGNNSDKISLGGIFISHIGLFFNCQTGLRNTWAVGKRQISACCAWFGGDDFNFTLTATPVIFEGINEF